jgi:hypothetical protein
MAALSRTGRRTQPLAVRPVRKEWVSACAMLNASAARLAFAAETTA